MQKARRHPAKGAPTACKRTVSGSIALRCSRFFSPFPHGTGSLSVSQEYLALADGAAGFRQGFTGPALLRITLRLESPSCTRLSRSAAALSRAVPLAIQSTISRSFNPGRAVTPPVWALPLSLTTTRGISFDFFSCGYLDVSVPRVRSCTCRCRASSPTGSPIRKSPDLRLFAPSRGLSQLVTSFVASESQGIPRTLFFDFLVSRVRKIVKSILILLRYV